MKMRSHTTAQGQTFEVPSHIVRLDGQRLHGWQLRFGAWRFFADAAADRGGAAAALRQARGELAARLATLPAPTGIRRARLAGKRSELPLGISPCTRLRPGRSEVHHYYQVTFPVFGGKTANKHVYVATENTLTVQRQQAALAKAMALRAAGEQAFREAKQGAQRLAALRQAVG